MRGRLGIIGGNKLSFLAVAENFGLALKTGAGEVKVLLPDVLKKTIPATMTDVVFGETNQSGGLARSSINQMRALGEWSSGILMIGDNGQNSETAILFEDFIREYQGSLTITRDAIDLLKNSANIIVERPNTLIVASFAQLQKIFQNVYYPKVLTFCMQLTNLVESLHKFTITYPSTIVVFHKDMLIASHGGNITTTPFNQPMQIWRGAVATRATAYWLWTPNKPLESTTTSLLNITV